MIERNKVYCIDSLEGLRKLEANSVDLIIADPPYYRIMVSDHKGKKYDWDKQWKSFKEYIDWCKEWFKEMYRVLKSNGSLYLFADDKNVSFLHIELERINFFLENHIIWMKPNNMPIKGWRNFRCYAPITERILFMSKEPRNTNLENPSYFENVKIFSPIVEYMIEQKRKIKELMGFETDEKFNNYVNRISGTASVVSRHYFTYSQWVFPTKEIYEKLQSINKDINKGRDYEVFRRDYEVFRRDYEELRRDYEELRREFSPKKNFTDVWTFNITSSSDHTFHPTQKPITLIRRIIETSSKEGDLIIDLFSGTGTTSIASKQLNRDFIGFEISQEYVDIANKRLSQQTLNTTKLKEATAIPPKPEGMGILPNFI